MTLMQFNYFLIVMSIIAVAVFVALFFVDAGYGKFYDRKWGPAVNNKLGWVLMESPVFFVTCVRTGWNAYEAHFRKFDEGKGTKAADMLRQYAAFLEEETRAHPGEWHHFHDFFA